MLRTTPALLSIASLLVLPVVFAADIEPYHATPLEPYHATTIEPARPAAEPAARPAQDVRPSRPAGDIQQYQSKPLEPAPAAAPAPAAPANPPSTQPPAAHRPAAANKSGNPVEPLSNGLRLSMTQADIVAKFGEPTEHTFDARTFGYPTFGVQCGGREAKIWHLTLKSGVRLSSGIGVGSARAEVARVFGTSPIVTIGQYKLTFRYNGDRVDQIGIAPANGEFAPAAAAAPKPGAAGNRERTPAASRSLVGTWYGAGDTKGQIELKSNGTYDWSGRPAGRYSVNGNTVKFTGSLEAWNNGVGTVNARGDAIEFYWTTPAGAKQYFVFIR